MPGSRWDRWKITRSGSRHLFNFTRTKVNGWEKTVNSYGAYVVRYTETEHKGILQHLHPPELPGELEKR